MNPAADRPAGGNSRHELAALWTGVYTESLGALEGASMRMLALVAGHSGSRRSEVESADLRVVLDDLEVARGRLGFWRARLAEVN